MLGLLLIRPSWDTDKPVWASNIPTLYARSQEWYWSESSTKKTTHRQTSLQQRLLCAPCWQETWHWVLPVQLFHRHWATETTQSRARSSSVIIIHCSKNCMKIHIHYTVICSVTPTNAQGQHFLLGLYSGDWHSLEIFGKTPQAAFLNLGMDT